MQRHVPIGYTHLDIYIIYKKLFAMKLIMQPASYMIVYLRGRDKILLTERTYCTYIHVSCLLKNSKFFHLI